MIIKMLLCASALMLGQAQATEPKPQPKAGKRSKKETRPRKVEKKSDSEGRAGGSSQAAGSGRKTEKVVDGVRLAAVEANIVSYTNQERADMACRRRSRQGIDGHRTGTGGMDDPAPFVHTRRPLAENIAMGQSHSSEAVGSWMGSSGHRANILNPAHRHIGVAAYHTPMELFSGANSFNK